jgi:HEAT repeat protein
MRQQKTTEYGLRAFPTLLLLTLFLVSSTPTHASLQVEWTEGHLSVNAEEIPLAQILQEVARQTGMEIRGLGGLQEQVSVHFVGLSLPQGLQKLSVNFAIVWETSPQGDPQPVLVLIFGRRVPSPPEAQHREESPGAEETEPAGEPMAEGPQPAGESMAEDAQAERLNALHTFAEQGNEEALWKALFDPDPTIQAIALALLAARDRQRVIAAIVEATKSDETELQLQALQLLSQTNQADEETVLAALSHALTDEAIPVKRYAIQALAHWEGADALGYLHQALHDPDPVVRRLVVEEIAGQDRGHLLLQEALGQQYPNN